MFTLKSEVEPIAHSLFARDLGCTCITGSHSLPLRFTVRASTRTYEYELIHRIVALARIENIHFGS